ncbi:MAG: type VI secretion system tip protein TssI/VgrG [Pirellulaceae bacterium]
MSSPEQASRLLSVTTGLGDDVLVLEAYRGREQLSQLFHFELDMLSTNQDIDPSSVVGTSATISVQLPSGDPRYINGMINRFAAGSPETWEQGYRRYRATIVPQFWFLSLNSDCRVYQNLAIPDIISQVFSNAGLTSFKDATKSTYSPLVYCVQYNESDFAFVSRLMQWAGIYYFFTHDNGSHTLTLCDDATGYVDCLESSVDYQDRFDPQLWGQIESWEHQYDYCAGKFAQTDYNFEDPDTSLLTNSSSVVSLQGNDAYEVFQYPGDYTTTSDGGPLTDARMQQREATYSVAKGTSSCASFFAGGKFSLSTHPIASEQGQSYALLSVEHDVVEPAAYTAQSGDDPAKQRNPIRNTFRGIPSSTVYRPPRTTPKPRIEGPQSAKVVGVQGNEIDTDQYGRVKVQFYWDRYGQFDENSSCWIRVVQRWADSGWGAHFIPRIGQEVLVEFLGGDPDRPVVTGCLYNANLMPPYTLPDNSTRSGVKTHSTPEGDEGASNEICFDDNKGQENFYVHAQRDYQRVVENNDTLEVGVGAQDPGDQTITIYNNRSVTIQQGDDTLEVQTGNRSVTIDKGNDTLEVKEGDLSISVDEGAASLEVKKGDRSVKVDEGNDTLEVSSGDHQITVSKGSSTIEAGQGITLKVGSNSIEITSSGVTIKGVEVSVQGSAEATLSSPKTSVSGDGEVTIQGGVVQIN